LTLRAFREQIHLGRCDRRRDKSLIAPGGSTLGPWVRDDDEAAPGAVIRRPGQPDRRVIGLLDLPDTRC